MENKILQNQINNLIASQLTDSAIKILKHNNPDIGKEYINDRDKNEVATALSHVFYIYDQTQIRMKQSR